MRQHLLPQSHSIGLPLSRSAPLTVEAGDAELVIASRNGDQDAFALLVQCHQRRVFNLVYRMLQDYEEANEVTQETFLAAWQGLPSFRGDARFSTWLYRIAYNCCLKQLETRKRDRNIQAAVEAEQMLESMDVDARANASLDVQDCQNAVREQLSTLPAKYRVVLVLRHLQEMTYEEMAEILTMPVGTIKTHLFRARNLLKERLESFEREWNAKTKG